MTNEDKKKKYRCEFKNKLIIFIYYLILFFTLNHFYQIYLIHLMT